LCLRPKNRSLQQWDIFWTWIGNLQAREKLSHGRQMVQRNGDVEAQGDARARRELALLRKNTCSNTYLEWV
jgi:hypothetical protein